MANDLSCSGKTYSKYVICPKGHFYYLDDGDYKKYFCGEKISCSWCKSEIDFWEGLKHLTGFGRDFGQHFTLLGCIEGQVEFVLKPKQRFELDMSKIIGDGKLLYINYGIFSSTEHYLYPLEWNSQIPTRDIRSNKIMIIPYSFFRDDAEETTIQAHYCYAPKEVLEDLPTSLLLDSFQHFYDKNYKYMIISAQTAIEIMQYNFFEDDLKKCEISHTKIKELLQEKITFAPQLFTVLKWMAKSRHFPLPPEKVLSNMKKLINSRNGLMHTGKIKSEWTFNDYQDMLLSAFLMYKYYQIVDILNIPSEDLSSLISFNLKLKEGFTIDDAKNELEHNFPIEKFILHETIENNPNRYNLQMNFSKLVSSSLVRSFIKQDAKCFYQV